MAWLGAALCCAAAPVEAELPSAPAFLQMVAVAPEAATAAPLDARWSIYLDGVIDADAAARLERFLARREVAGAVVYLNSPGGSLPAAMALGRLLRGARFDARVGARAVDSGRVVPGVCSGACAFALAGGLHRQVEPGSWIGVERLDSGPPGPDETAAERRARFEPLNYLAEMGVDAALVDLMAGVPYGTTRPLAPEEAARFGLID